MQELEVYSMIGAEGFGRLVAAFYRQVPQDELLGRMYPAQDLAGAEQRLRDFLIGRFGGPQTYIEQRGHPRLRARHSPFRIDQTVRDRWIRLMNSRGRVDVGSLYPALQTRPQAAHRNPRLTGLANKQPAR